ncbi:alpha-N-acetylgalactosaminidase [Metarhizium album ARSEF 1941]|uniref:Alpha-galactosidase n=1 Tax=Metarhizium album (strain ARSEF 1941) TaxID=1081103 RepID=A0A0B2WWE3_METAS|nr:alpha-N-acetylgalactosaminidase [Metarhizium album ARSEF 1941]KHN98373.1 alpha-N-acetylgalactosaminidase [Metarhizium album ARSEF 1941]
MKARAAVAFASLAASSWAMNREPPPIFFNQPPMGFNSWARYTTNVNETLLVETANSMARNGLLQAGYNRINLDEGWSLPERGINGSLVADPDKFPTGLKWLTEYLNMTGFISGIHADAGSMTCGKNPGSFNYEKRDVDDFMDQGFYYVKLDGCNMRDDTEETYHDIFNRWPKVIRQASVDRKETAIMALSSSAPAYFAYRRNLTDWYRAVAWASEYSQLARHSADVATYGDGSAWKSIMHSFDQSLRLGHFQRPGFYLDPDVLLPDHPSLSLEERKTQFALWCSMSSPLLFSADVPRLDPDTLAFLTNKDLIAADQDDLAQPATLVSRDSNWDVLAKNLENEERLITVFNRGDTFASLNVSWFRTGITPKLTGNGNVRVTDLWTGEVSFLPVYLRFLNVTNVPPHGTAVYRLRSASVITPTGHIYNANTFNCLTDDPSGYVRWAVCNGYDSQVWRVRSDGHIYSLLRPRDCLVELEGTVVTRKNSCHHHPWTYKTSGNLVNNVSGKCLTEGADGSVTTEGCGYLLNEQIFVLPAGIELGGW